MIHVFFTILSVLILTAAIVSRGGIPREPQPSSEVLSEQSEVTDEATPTPTDSPLPIETLTPTPETTATPSATHTPNATDGWVYPGSQVIRTLPLSLTNSSVDNWRVITDWYKNRIKSEGYNVTSFIVTSTKTTDLSSKKDWEKVYNNLTAEKRGRKIEVLIIREKIQDPLKISVSITSQN